MDETPDDSADQDETPRRPGGPQLWTRRGALRLMGSGGLAGASYLLLQNALDDGTSVRPGGASASREVRTSPAGQAATTTTESADVPPGFARWSDPATWGGRVPGARDVAVVERPVLLDVDAEAGGVRIARDGELMFDPAASRTLRTTGNVAVDGALRMRPADAETVHRLTFTGIDESVVVGGHTHTALPTDVGLWVLGTGEVEVAGTAKTAWTRLTGPVRAGATRFEVAEADGWRAGDEIVVTPTEPATVEDYAYKHDRVAIASVDGTTITVERPLEHPHPEVTVRDGATWHAEALNLTRNTIIEGTAQGRAHVMILSSRPQSLAYVELPHMGPQEPNPESPDEPDIGVLGRYGVHFHMVGDGSRGSVVAGAVARDGGNHAFVAHLSNGVTFRDCIAHDMVEDAFWWDFGPDEDASAVPSHDITYERCVAHLIHHGSDKFDLAGFVLGAGDGNAVRGCVAIGILGATESAAGFAWPAASNDERYAWVFEDSVAHNCANSALYFWQNEVPHSIVDRFTGYHCGHGIFAGSYSNLVSYRDCTVYACRESGLVINAVPGSPRRGDETITFEGMYVDQQGLTDHAVDITEHIVDSDRETALTGCTFAGGSRAQVAIPNGSELHQLYRFHGCTFHGNAFWLGDDVPSHTTIRVDDDQHGSIVVRRADQSGDLNRDWNAAVSPA
jgi:hypothetical protein